jgi:hypothetical protein
MPSDENSVLRTNSRASLVYIDTRSVRDTVVRGQVGKPHSTRWYPERFAVSRNECDAMILRARIQGWMDRIRFRRQFVRRIVFLPKESCFENET